MQEEILINWSPQETRVAIVENGAVQELHLERNLERGLVGNVYMGKVSRVLPGMQSAFIDIGLDKAAFLHVADVWRPHKEEESLSLSATSQPLQPIERQVFQGQSLLVQVIKDPISTKGARLSTQISIAGRFLVYLPQDNHIGISQKIDPILRNQLKERLQILVGLNGGGFILRTNGEDANDQELSDDIAYLRLSWSKIKEKSFTSPVLSLLHQDLNLLHRVLRDLAGEFTQSIRVDSKEQFHLLKEFSKEFMPKAGMKLTHYKGERPVFDLFSIDEEISKALGRRVDLKSGGYMVIDQTEALTTIDVNTGGFVGVRNFDDTIFRTNLEATQAIARQLRLRNLGGIVIVDFIDMVQEDHQNLVLTELNKQLEKDRVKTKVSRFSQLGLVEMTRKRTRESLARMLCEPCSICNGKGITKTVRSVTYDIFREILRESRQFNPSQFRIVASPKVIELFLDEESQHLASLSEFIGKPISLQSETAMAQEQYDIVLL